MKESIGRDRRAMLCMNVPVELDKIYELIRFFRNRFRESGEGGGFRIRQIVLLNKNPLYSQEANVNLSYLAELLPMADCFGEDYQVHYQYVRGTECDHGLLMWPYYILFPEKILFLSADAGSGWVEERPEILRMARRLFDRQIESAPLLFHVYPDNVEAFSVYCNNFRELKMPSYTLENAPCMTLMYDRQILEQLCAGLPEEYGALVTGAAEYYETAGSMPLTSTMFFAESGLKLFLEQGVVMGGIAEFLGKIPEMSRRPMLERFIERWHRAAAKIHMLNEVFLTLDCPLMMEVFENRKIALFLLSPDRQIVYLEIEEVSICEAVNDFLGHLTDLRMAYDGEETEKRMRELMQP